MTNSDRDNPSGKLPSNANLVKPSFPFRKSQRLLTTPEFELVFRQRHKAADGVLLIFSLPNRKSMSRLGLSVSRKVGRAHVRNRVKRLLREAFRLEQYALPTGWDWVVIPLDIQRASLDQYRQSLKKLTHKLALRGLRKNLAAMPEKQP